MSEKLILAAARRAILLRQRLRRYKLVFAQCGSTFDPLRELVLEKVGGVVVSAVEFAASAHVSEEITGPLVITGAEVFAADGESGGRTLGQLRKRIDEELDEGAEVCVVSRSPRASYFAVPGSSIIEDASVFCLPLLAEDELENAYSTLPGSALPAVGLLGEIDLKCVFRKSLDELGVNVLAALDHALFEADDRRSFPVLLDPRETEALRGAGFAEVREGSVEFPFPQRLNEFVDATADALAAVVDPHPDLAAVSDGLWFMERTIRRHLRDAAIGKFGSRWRRQTLYGDLPAKTLERARSDANVTATSVGSLRDPIEWLSLGELLEVVQSKNFNGLHFDEVSWRRFAQDIIPIRNRLSHMRLLKKGDREAVIMWVARVKSNFR